MPYKLNKFQRLQINILYWWRHKILKRRDYFFGLCNDIIFDPLIYIEHPKVLKELFFKNPKLRLIITKAKNQSEYEKELWERLIKKFYKEERKFNARK